MHRQLGDASFADALLPEKVGRNARLEQVDAVLDWDPLAEVVGDLYAAPEGRPSYPPLLMVKVLLLQQWYTASDPEIEAALWDRLSFRRFAGLGLQGPVPDHSTISRFRSALAARGLGERLFAEVTRQLDAAGWLVKAGTLMDATLVAAQARRPPPQAGPGAGSPTDPGTTWTRQGGPAHFGYKAHLGVDAQSRLIRRAVLTPAHVNESEVADTLISGDERAVYADKAYESKARRARLHARGIKDRIMHRSHKHQRGLPYWQQRRNVLIAPVRAPVEHVFGTLKRSYGYRTVRYLGLARIDPDHRQTGRGQAGHYEPLVAAAGFQHDAGRPLRLELLRQAPQPAPRARHRPGRAAGLDRDVQLGLGHIDPDRDVRGSCHWVPSGHAGDTPCLADSGSSSRPRHLFGLCASVRAGTTLLSHGLQRPRADRSVPAPALSPWRIQSFGNLQGLR